MSPSRPSRTVLARALAFGLLWLAPALAPAQEEKSFFDVPQSEYATDHSVGDAVPGYIATGILGGLTIFVLCKSARR